MDARRHEDPQRRRREDGMLVLSRKRTEQIVIGSTTRITVVRVVGNQVRLGIEAPEDLTILRAELVGERAPKRDDGPSPPGRTRRR